MNAEEDVQDLRFLLSGLDPTQGVMLLPRSEGSLHRRRSHSRKFLSLKVFLPFLLRALAFLDKGCLDAITCAHLTVGITGITRVTAYLLHVHSEQPLMHLDAVSQPCTLVEGVEGQLLNERYPVHQDVVALGSELNTLHFLASHDWPHKLMANLSIKLSKITKSTYFLNTSRYMSFPISR